MNVMIIKTLTSRPARRVYKKMAIGGLKLAGTITGEVVTYFAANGIIKAIRKKTDFEPVEPVTIRLVNVPLTEVEA